MEGPGESMYCAQTPRVEGQASVYLHSVREGQPVVAASRRLTGGQWLGVCVCGGGRVLRCPGVLSRHPEE